MTRSHRPKIEFRLIIAALALFGTPLFAATDNFLAWPKQLFGKTWHPVIALGVGPSFSSDVGSNNYFPIINPSTDEFYYYQPQSSTLTAGLFDGFIGVEGELYNNWSLQTGLGYDITTTYHVNGSLTQGADVPSQDTYSYSYQIANQQLMAEAKLLYKFRERYHPYVFLGLGAAFNSAYNFETSVPPFLTFTRNFQNDQKTAFTYAIGLGIDMDVSQNLRFGIGYRFTNLGQVNLGNASINGIPVSGEISQSHFYLNQLLLQVSWIG